MRHQYDVLLTYLALFLLPGIAMAQRGESNDVSSAVRELWALKSTDGRGHEIEAIALGRSGDTEVVYVVERLSDLLVPGSPKPTGEFLFWTLDVNGQVLHKEFITKMLDFEPPRVTIVPLPAPQEGAIIIGMFEERFGWSLRRVDRAGKIAESVTLIHESGAFEAAVLLPDTNRVLLAGQIGFIGNVWKLDLDGNAVWKKTYKFAADGTDANAEDTKATADVNTSAQFHSIALNDDRKGFVLAGDFGEINKFGFGQRSVWLVRCDEAGTVLSETTFPGRLPSICRVGKEGFAVVYDVGSAMEFDGRMRVVDLQLKELWEKKAEFASLLFDKPAISPVPFDRGFVVAGCNIIVDQGKKSMRRECQVRQYDVNGQIVSSASIPVARETFLQTRIVCGADRAFVACQTKGMTPLDAKEASVFEIGLRK